VLARVSSYDALGSVMTMPAGALVAGPVAAVVGVPATQYGAAVLIIAASLLALIPRDVRQRRPAPSPGAAAVVLAEAAPAGVTAAVMTAPELAAAGLTPASPVQPEPAYAESA
jgi:hypothetical protein